MDLNGEITFGGGLSVDGELQIKDGTDLHITTDHVVVQGLLSIGDVNIPIKSKVASIPSLTSSSTLNLFPAHQAL